MRNLAKGNFQFQENPPREVDQLVTIPPPLEDIPSRAGTPWPRAGSTSENLSQVKKGLANSPTPTSTPTIKVEPQLHEVAIPHAAVAPMQIEKCGWGPNCPICKNIEEDWGGELQNQQCPKQNILHTQKQGTQQPLQKNISNAPRTKTPSNHRTSSTPNLLTYLIVMQNKYI